MKCQSCNYICSEKNDLCPRCQADLRPEKKAQGLVIEHPNIPYSQLLNAQKIRLVENTTPATILTSENNTSAYNLIANAFKREAPLNRNSSIQHTTSHAEGQVANIQATNHTSEIFSSHFLKEKDAICQLFNSADVELINQESTEFELVTFQPENRQEIRLFFDLAEQSVADPSSETKYTQLISTADTKVLESSFLAKQLTTVEKAMSAGLINLKNTFKTSVTSPENKSAEIAKFCLLDKQSVAKMYLIDFSSSLIITLLCWFGYLQQGEIYFWNTLSSSTSNLLQADFLALFSSFGLVLVWATYGYYFVMLNLFGSTFGMDIINSKLVHFSGREANSQEKLARSLILPTALLTFTWVLDFKNQFNWADRLSNTICGQEMP